MGFFGEEISDQKVELEVPEHYTLNLSQACLWPVAQKDVDVTTLFVKTVNEDVGFALCSLGGSQPVRFCSLRHEFGAEDSPLLLYTCGKKIHLTGSWSWTTAAEEFDDDGSCESTDEDDARIQEGDSGFGHDDGSDNSKDKDSLVSKASEATGKSSKRKRGEDDDSLRDNSDGANVEKKTTRNKRGGKSDSDVVPANQLVVVSKPPTLEALGQVWKIKPQNDEGIIVPVPKQKTLKTGVLITDYCVGKGAEPKLGSTVKITYQGMFPNGKVFDKNTSRKKPLKFRVGSGQVIRGLDLGMDKMRVGGSREIVIPPALGYGKEGIADIPGNQVLVFRITLIGVEKKSLSKR